MKMYANVCYMSITTELSFTLSTTMKLPFLLYLYSLIDYWAPHEERRIPQCHQWCMHNLKTTYHTLLITFSNSILYSDYGHPSMQGRIMHETCQKMQIVKSKLIAKELMDENKKIQDICRWFDRHWTQYERNRQNIAPYCQVFRGKVLFTHTYEEYYFTYCCVNLSTTYFPYGISDLSSRHEL